MIFNTNLTAQRNRTYESSIKNLEKAKEILEQKFAKKEISNEYYIQKCKEIDNEINKCRMNIGQE